MGSNPRRFGATSNGGRRAESWPRPRGRLLLVEVAPARKFIRGSLLLVRERVEFPEHLRDRAAQRGDLVDELGHQKERVVARRARSIGFDRRDEGLEVAEEIWPRAQHRERRSDFELGGLRIQLENWWWIVRRRWQSGRIGPHAVQLPTAGSTLDQDDQTRAATGAGEMAHRQRPTIPTIPRRERAQLGKPLWGIGFEQTNPENLSGEGILGDGNQSRLRGTGCNHGTKLGPNPYPLPRIHSRSPQARGTEDRNQPAAGSDEAGREVSCRRRTCKGVGSSEILGEDSARMYFPTSGMGGWVRHLACRAIRRRHHQR